MSNFPETDGARRLQKPRSTLKAKQPEAGVPNSGQRLFSILQTTFPREKVKLDSLPLIKSGGILLNRQPSGSLL